jgi:hypothetical protein
MLFSFEELLREASLSGGSIFVNLWPVSAKLSNEIRRDLYVASVRNHRFTLAISRSITALIA